MSTIIDSTYLAEGLLAIPNITDTSSVGVAIAANAQKYINEFEPEFLRMLLGDDLYDEYIDAPDEERFADLIAVLRDATNKTSPIAKYVWLRYQEFNQIITTEGGDKKTQPAGMTSASNEKKMCTVWNRMVQEVDDVIEWMEDSDNDYSSWGGCDDSLTTKINIMGV